MLSHRSTQIERLVQILKNRNMTIATAESCTGGLLGKSITDISGSSAVYPGGVISYCTRVKHELLGVDQEILDTLGAVSAPVARQMAEGVRRVFRADIGASATGYAGPGGGTPTKPVGTAWLAAAKRHPDGNVTVVTECVHFASSRAVNIERFASHALDLLRRNM